MPGVIMQGYTQMVDEATEQDALRALTHVVLPWAWAPQIGGRSSRPGRLQGA